MTIHNIVIVEVTSKYYVFYILYLDNSTKPNRLSYKTPTQQCTKKQHVTLPRAEVAKPNTTPHTNKRGGRRACMHGKPATRPPPAENKRRRRTSKAKPARGAKKHACMHVKHTRLSDRLCKRGKGGGGGESGGLEDGGGRGIVVCMMHQAPRLHHWGRREGGGEAHRLRPAAECSAAFADFPVGLVFARRFPTERRDFGGILLMPVSLAGGGGGGAASRAG